MQDAFADLKTFIFLFERKLSDQPSQEHEKVIAWKHQADHSRISFYYEDNPLRRGSSSWPRMRFVDKLEIF